MLHVRLLPRNVVRVVLVLLVLDVINSNKEEEGVLLGKVIILHELPPRLLEEKQVA